MTTLPTRTSRWRRVTASLAAIALLAGCSSVPRDFKPKLEAPPADPGAYEKAYLSCKAQVAAGKRDQFQTDRGTSAVVGVGVGTALAVGSAAGAGSSMVAGAAAGVAGAAALFVVAPLVIFGTARYIRSGKEDEIKQATALCLNQNGYAVKDWELIDD